MKIFLKNLTCSQKKTRKGAWLTIKGTIPYEMIARYNSLDIWPEDGNFFLLHYFFLALMTVDENVKKFYQTMKLKDVELSLIKSIISKTYNSLWNIWTMIWTTSKAF